MNIYQINDWAERIAVDADVSRSVARRVIISMIDNEWSHPSEEE